MTEGEEPPELTALNANMTFIKSTITSELDWFSDSLVAKNFLKRERAGAILRMVGTEDREFMDDVYKAIKNAGNKRERFDDFVDIFSHNAAYKELVKSLKCSVVGDQSDEQTGSASLADAPDSSTPLPHTGKLNIEKDMLEAKLSLKNLKKGEMKNLFQELGLYFSTVDNDYEGSDKGSYSESLIRAWILERDDVLKSKHYRGGATWENLRTARMKLSL